MLFPSFVAGLIIGKDGAEISNLMNSTQTNVKFSPGRELYPGTQDRVCTIVGYIPNIVAAVRGIFDKIKTSEHSYDQELLKSLKMLISNIASGMVIGKSGGTVKMIQQDYNVRIQITNKDETRGLPERTMIIMSENPEYILAAFQNVLERILHDPEAEKWKRLVSYSSHTITPSHPTITHTSSLSSSSSAIPNQMTDYSSFIQSVLHQQQQQQTYASLGSFPSSTTGTSNNTSFPPPSNSETANQPSLANAMLTYMYSQSLTTNSAYFSRYAPVMIDGVNLTIPGSTLSTFEVAIPEVMVNSVLGTGLKLITDVMQSTGTRLQLSGKGDYIPGTYNRKLTITGPILSVQAAHLIVMQNIIREQETYRKQGLI